MKGSILLYAGVQRIAMPALGASWQSVRLQACSAPAAPKATQDTQQHTVHLRMSNRCRNIGCRLALLLQRPGLGHAGRRCSYTGTAAGLPALLVERAGQSRQRRRYCASRPRVKARPSQSGEPRTRARSPARRAARPGTSAAACTARRTYSSSLAATQPPRMPSTASSETPTLCAWHRPAIDV